MSNKQTTRTADKARKTVKKVAGKALGKAKTKASPKRAAQQTTSGNQIRRDFKGKELVIDIVDGKFIYEGQTFASLSALAKSIVGYGISGPHFFRMAMPKPGKLTGGE